MEGTQEPLEAAAGPLALPWAVGVREVQGHGGNRFGAWKTAVP